MEQGNTDVNGSAFQILMGRADWLGRTEPAGGGPTGLEWEDESSTVRLLREEPFRFPRNPADPPLGFSLRRGAACDRYGAWYWIGEGENEIRRSPGAFGMGGPKDQIYWSEGIRLASETPSCPGAGGFGDVDPPPSRPLKLRGLAITEDQYLVVGSLEPMGLWIFDLPAGGAPVFAAWTTGLAFHPLDLTPRAGGGVWILDRQGGFPANPPSPDQAMAPARLWGLDRGFGPIPGPEDEALAEMDGGFAVDAPAPLPPGPARRATLAHGFPITGLHRPAERAVVAVEALPDGSLLLLESPPSLPYSILHRFRPAGSEGPASFPQTILLRNVFPAYTGESQADDEDGSARYADLKAFDIAFVPAEGSNPPGKACACATGKTGSPATLSGTLYLTHDEGNQTFAFRAERAADGDMWEFTLLPRFLPMRRFDGKGLVRGGGGLAGAYYSIDGRWVPLAEQKRARYLTDGKLTVGPLDGKQPGCNWHRVCLDAAVPGESALQIESRSADDPADLPALIWEREPDPYLRSSSEQPFHRPFGPRPDAGTAAESSPFQGSGTWETLLQRRHGRFLELRLTFRGNGRSTPRLRCLRAHYPRFSYLQRYLPAVYREADGPDGFLERFLANFEGMYTDLEGRIAAADRLFDLRTTPGEYLDWLGSWFGLLPEAGWEDWRKRLFLAHAVELFAQKGTLPGLLRMLRVATDSCPDPGLFSESGLADLLGCPADGHRGAGFSLRVVEDFRLRRAPGSVFGNPSERETPGTASPRRKWDPSGRSVPLRQVWLEFLKARYPDIADLRAAWEDPQPTWATLRMPAQPPASAAGNRDWREFLATVLGFAYHVPAPGDVCAYREFLAHRYGRVTELRKAYGLGFSDAHPSFAVLEMPQEIPDGGPALLDWIQFVSVYLPGLRQAHRFTVLVPVRIDAEGLREGPDMELVRGIVEREKPAHTDFEIREYWALFRVGEARLGLDSLLGEGARLVPAVLGSMNLAGTHLVHSFPYDLDNRLILGSPVSPRVRHGFRGRRHENGNPESPDPCIEENAHELFQDS